MPDQTDITEQLELLDIQRRTLAHYLRQEAMLGSAHTPPGLSHGITTARSEIQRLKAVLRHWGVAVEDHPNDVASAETGDQPRRKPRSAAPAQGGVQISAGQVRVGGDVVGRDKISTSVAGAGVDELTELAKKFAQIKQKIDQRVVDSDIDKTEVRELVERIEQEVMKGDAANPNKVERWLRFLAATANDIFQLTVATLDHPFTAVAQTIQSVARKLRRLA